MAGKYSNINQLNVNGYIYITPTSIGINMYNKIGKTFTATIMMRVLWGFAGDIQGNGV
jgi:hypothetical protein